MSKVLLNAPPLSAVGRIGHLTLEYRRDGSQTILSRSSATSPWHVFPPARLDGSGCAYTYLMNPSGGFVGGDRLSIDASLGEGTHVLVSTPSANRVYRSAGETAVHMVRVQVGPGAILEWLPEVTIPFAGARFSQAFHGKLQAGATLLLWDAMASGRVARGERWAFTAVENEITVSVGGEGSVAERYRLAPAHGYGVGLAEPWDYVASLFVVGDAVKEEVWAALEERLNDALDGTGAAVLGGVSRAPVSGIAAKVVARSAPDLEDIRGLFWCAIRTLLWGLPGPALRRY
jgi:urease accessory protein